MLDGQQWAANSARLFAKQSAPRRKQRETIGHCFESGEAIAKKRGKNVDVGVEGKYLGGGGAIRRKRERERKEACLWSLEISLIDWPQGESTKLLKIAMHLKCGQHLIHDTDGDWWRDIRRWLDLLVWLWNDCQTERNIVQKLFEIVRLWCLILYECSWSNVLIMQIMCWI